MKKQLLFIAIFFMFFTCLSAQIIISGTIKDELGEPLPYANVVIKGTNFGTTADIEGNFQLSLKKELDTLVVSFIGFETKEIIPANKRQLEVLMDTGVCLPEFTKVGYVKSYCTKCVTETLIGRCCCYCYFGYTNSPNSENWSKPIAATPLSYGATKLDYQIDVRWVGAMNDYFKKYKNKKVFYQISKSTDDVYYKVIGQSASDTLMHFLKDNGNDHALFGGSQFLDKEKNKAAVTYYKVEGYVLIENTNDDEEEPVKEYIFNEKIHVKSEAYLNIKNVYAHKQTPQLNVEIASPTDNQNTEFIISDVSGRVLVQHQAVLYKNVNSLALETGILPSGMYVLFVKQGQQTDSQKFTVVH